MKQQTADALVDAIRELAKFCNDVDARLKHAEQAWKRADEKSYNEYQAQLGAARHRGVPVVVGKSLDKLRSALTQD
jgi:hypothetical protein